MAARWIAELTSAAALIAAYSATLEMAATVGLFEQVSALLAAPVESGHWSPGNPIRRSGPLGMRALGTPPSDRPLFDRPEKRPHQQPMKSSNNIVVS